MSRVFIALFVLLTSAALIILKLGMKTGAPIELLNGKLQLNINAYTVFGVMLYGFSFIVYMYLLSKYNLGYIIPLTTALVYIIIFSASYFIFHEVFTATKIFGIALIVIGLMFLNLKQ